MEFMDLCLSCRACEDVCPSHVPFGSMMERARFQVEPSRPARHRFARWLGLEVALPRGWLLTLATVLLPLVRPLLPRRLRRLLPRVRLGELARRLPRVTEATGPAGSMSAARARASCTRPNCWTRPTHRGDRRARPSRRADGLGPGLRAVHAGVAVLDHEGGGRLRGRARPGHVGQDADVGPPGRGVRAGRSGG